MSAHACDECAVLREHYRTDPWVRPMFNPACLHCGARYIQRLQRKSGLPDTAKRDRCRAVLEDWKAHGHAEGELRALAKQERWAVAPAAGREKK